MALRDGELEIGREEVTLSPAAGSGGGAASASLTILAGVGPLMDERYDRIFAGSSPAGLFGRSIATGDVDGDGVADLLVGSPGFDARRGRVFGFDGPPWASRAEVAFHWDTASAQPGDHTLRAKAILASGVVDGDPSDDLMEASIAIQAPPPKTMHVESIVMSLRVRKTRLRTFTKAIATITVLDAENHPVEGASVFAVWSKATRDSDSGATDGSGVVTFESDEVKNARSGTTFTITIVVVAKEGWIFDPKTGETSDSISVK